MKSLFTLIACCFVHVCFSQIQIDLSKRIAITQSVNPERITSITLINALPIAPTSYSISIIVKHTSPPVLSIPTAGGGGAAGVIPGACSNVDGLTAALDAETDETKIPIRISDLQTAINAIPAASAAACTPYVAQANHEIAATTIVIPVDITIGKNDELNITIIRDTKRWEYNFKNEQPNHFTTYYGFTFIPDVLTKFPNYFADQQSGGSYTITKMNGGNKNVFQNVSPTAMFTYRFFDKKPDAIGKFGLTGGIFYNTEILGAMFGPSLVIGDAITLNTGISFVQKYKLKGQYKEGQIITTNLTFDQLHDKIWTYDMFLSIGFNLPELFTKKNNSNSTSSSGSGSSN